MTWRNACIAGIGLLVGCSGNHEPFDTNGIARPRTAPEGAVAPRRATEAAAPQLRPDSPADDFVSYALFHSPRVEAAFQRWRSAAERLPQQSAPPDPRLRFTYDFRDEEAVLGVMQSIPWPGTLRGREDAAAAGAIAAWREFEASRVEVAEEVLAALHELVYLDRTTEIARRNLALVESIEEVVRARYRVGAGTHPELVRVQVELGELDDRVRQLEAMRPAYLAELNAALGREPGAEVGQHGRLPEAVVAGDARAMAELAARSNPMLLALDDRAEQERRLARVAGLEGRPELEFGIDYTLKSRAMNGSFPESRDDPVMLTFGISIPLWRERYNAAVREATARRLAVASERADAANRISAAVHRAWFEHTDAHRRVGLYERTLIPKAEESLRASLARFRAGEATLLELLDTERTLLEFAVVTERARADRGRALARLDALIGTQAPRRTEEETQP